MLHIVLFEPEIPPNTGNVIRLCANTGARLHLVQPLGFDLDHAKLRRAGLDYREFAEVSTWPTLAAFVDCVAPRCLYAISTRGSTRFDSVRYDPQDAVVFGPETRGLPQALLDDIPPAHVLRVPMRPGNRSLNLSNAVAVVAFEAWRQRDYAGGA